MKKILFTVLIILSCFAYSQNDVLKLASDVWPPFTDISGEKAFAMDLVKEALARTGVKVEFDILDFEDVIIGIDRVT